jgi:hypothetical protein
VKHAQRAGAPRAMSASRSARSPASAGPSSADGSHQDDLVRRPACERLGERGQAPHCVVGQTDQHERAGALLDGRDGGARRALQRRILSQDRALEILELGPRLDAEVVEET